MLNLQALEAALKPIQKIGNGELSFVVEGQTMAIRTLLPHEDIAVSKYASVALEGQGEGEHDTSSMSEFIERFQISLISYALVEINGLDLRNAEFVETGEMLDNGVAVKEAKPAVLRKMLHKFSRAVRQNVFRHYAELLDQVESETDRVVRYSSAELDKEIARATTRLAELTALKERRVQESEEKHPFVQQIRAMAEAQKAAEEQAAQEDTQESVEAPVPETPAPQEQAPVVPQTMQPQAPVPVRVDSIMPDFRNQQVAPPPQHAPRPVPAQQTPQQAAHVQQPVAPESPQEQPISQNMSEEEEMIAEEMRLLNIRKARLQSQQVVKRPAPHLGAREDAANGAEEPVQHVQIQQAGTVNGLPAYKLESNDPYMLTDKTPARDPSQVVVNRDPSAGTINPKFRPIK